MEGTKENPTVINNNIQDIIKVEDNKDRLLYTTREVKEGITIKGKQEEDITTDSRVDLDKRFDPDSESHLESDFDDYIHGDKDIEDKNMWSRRR